MMSVRNANRSYSTTMRRNFTTSSEMAARMARPRRSVLFMPANNERAVSKILSGKLGADVVIMDLEDGVAAARKDTARESLVQFFCDRTTVETAREKVLPELVVRLNGLDTPFGRADVEALGSLWRNGDQAMRPDAVTVPKVESSAQLLEWQSVLREVCGSNDIPPLWCNVETPLGVLRAQEIAATEGVEALVMGTSDLVQDLHARHTRDRAPVLTSLSLVVLAARAYHRTVLDGVQLALDLPESDFEAECEQARSLGFDGKTLIHPKTVAAANRVFRPSAEQVEIAQEIIDAHEAAKGDMVVVRGRLIEELHAREARRTLELEKNIRLIHGGN